MTETTILNEAAVSEIEARAGDKWTVNTDTIRALCATVKHLRAESFRYKTGFDDYVRKLETDNERLTTGLVNLYHVITNQQCERKVALGMATSAVSSLQSQLEQLREENERLEKVIALWFGPNSCSVCGGAPLASGKPCVCGGKGTMQAEHEGLRQALYDADISGTKIQQERDSLRGTLSALNNCRNKPVCGHCNALLREAESQYQGEM